MRLETRDLQRLVASTGFRGEVLEKVIRLLELLDGIRAHPFLQSRVVLKGGTALNLFLLEMPRLSVDIDLNYVGAVDRDGMQADRPRVDQALQAVCGRLDLQVRRAPIDHAGGKWRLTYHGADGRSGTLELDMNYLLRTPLWPTAVQDSLVLGPFAARGMPMLDPHEIAAGKLAALFGRTASRDLFDARELLSTVPLDPARLRLGFVVYGGMNRRDWREVTLDELQADPEDVERRLLPVLRARAAPDRSGLAAWSSRLVDQCRELLSFVLPFRDAEIRFLARLNDHGEILPELLTKDPEQQARLLQHPGLRWKALNVRRFRGGDDRMDDDVLPR